MAGELYEVWGRLHFSATAGCPAELKGTNVQVKSRDGNVFELPAAAAYISLRFRRIITHSGTDEEIVVPFNREVTAKVVAYLKHHQDEPASELQMPLQSKNLVDCGASAWDAKFVNEERDVLFDLSLAASLLEIPSLFILAGARLATTLKDKAPNKLPKDFGYEDDADPEEMENLQWGFEAAGHRLEDGAGLAQCTVMMNGVRLAAERHGVLGASSTTQAQTRSWRDAAWRAAVLTDWKVLTSAPEEVRSDRELIEAAIRASFGMALLFATDELKGDRQLVLQAVAFSGAALKYAAPELQSDRDFVLEAIKVQGASLAEAAEACRADRDLVLQAAHIGRGSVLQGASPELLVDRELVARATEWDPVAFKYADEGLRHDREFCLHVAWRCGAALQHMPEHLKADLEIVAAAVASDPDALAFAHAARRADLGLPAPWDEPSQMEPSFRQPAASPDSGPGFVSLTTTMFPCGERSGSQAMKMQKIVYFSGFGTVMGGLGQSNYIAANCMLDRWSSLTRTVVEGTTVMWGAIGGVGMRMKTFGSMDVLNQAPENFLTITDSCKVLQVVCGRMDVPEWFAACNTEPAGREAMLIPTAGYGSGGGWKPGEDAGLAGLGAARAWPGPDGGAAATGPTVTGQPEQPEQPGAKEPPAPEDGPLGGWPALQSPAAAPQKPGSWPLVVGSRVRLCGLKTSKNGATGRTVAQKSNGRWMVNLDNDLGKALLKEDYLEPIADP
mmetsp:Transcript_88207/g.285522  ORF Transcript_88207/g.285522 Transcript_88207/m.285522 type:complete len:730 (-) Transcript_88207:124-2313(-)